MKNPARYNGVMLVLYERISRLPIVSLQTGGVLAHIKGPVIDPRHLHVVAFYCEGPGLEGDYVVLHTDDIREVSNIGLIVDSNEDLMAPDDLVRLQEVLKFDFTLADKLVVDDTGHKLGKVSNFALETQTFYIVKLHVKPALLSSMGTAERIVDRTQILEITDKKIIVKSAIIESKQSVKTTPKLVENPFRRHPSPQPDSSTLPR